MRGVKYIGPVFDASGYAEAARNYVLAIHELGYPITLEPISFEETRPELGGDGRTLAALAGADIDYDKVILHATPDTWAHYGQHDSNLYRVGYTVWEATELHPIWRHACEQVDEVWVPSHWNKSLFEESGVGTPVTAIPHTIAVPDVTSPTIPPPVELAADTYVFYSIFHWQERKNPEGLLAAYFAAFTGEPNVTLVLKTYVDDHECDAPRIGELVAAARSNLALDHYPRVVPLVANLSSEEILALHRRGDCFVLLQRAEGWGLPHFEAAACGNPVITPGFGGQTDFIREETGYLVDYSLTPVTGMSWSPFYLGTQRWCEPDLAHAVRTLRHVFRHRSEARERGIRARRFIAERFTRPQVGKLIVDRLRQIDRRLGER